MRRRFLFSIGSLILTIALLSSCIKGENDEVAFSIDASVRAFSIDSINGVKYPFSIDLLRSSIYNKDSLPYLSDTLLKSFVIDTFSVSGAVFAADTMMSFPATVDLTKAMNGADGIMFTVYAADGRTTRNYRLDVRVHLQDPDSLSWGQIANLPEDFQKADLGTSPKVVNFGKQLLIFSSLDCYHTSLDNAGSYALEASAISGLPTSVDWSSLQLFDDLLFVRTAEGDVYTSADGQLWGKHPSLSGGVKTLLAGMSQLLLGIQTVDGTDYFCHARPMILHGYWVLQCLPTSLQPTRMSLHIPPIQVWSASSSQVMCLGQKHRRKWCLGSPSTVKSGPHWIPRRCIAPTWATLPSCSITTGSTSSATDSRPCMNRPAH